MEKEKNFFAILGFGITIGVIIAVIFIFVIRATPKSINVGGVEFEIQTPTVSQYQEPIKVLPSPTNIPIPTDLPAIISVPTQTVIIPTQNSNVQSSGTLSSCPSFQNGETRTVAPGTFVLGDITIDGAPQFTNNIGEGTIAYFEKESSVFATWGAGCYLGDKSLIEQVIQDELQHGCGSVCTSIRFVLVQNDGQHVELRK